MYQGGNGGMCGVGAPAHRGRRSRGFTLLEMMLVVVIMGLLMAVAVWNILGQGEKAKIKTTQASMHTIKGVLTAYKLDKGTYPASLAELTVGQTPYLETLPKDAWKHEFVYATPGANGKPFTLYSLGSDGEAGTQDDIDIWVEQTDEAAK